MKANEAPEKIYLQDSMSTDTIGDLWPEWFDAKVSDYSIEYTQTDAFIEKACSGIDKLLSGYIIRNFHFGDSYDIDRLIDDFKNYMKGE